jgi:polysaccharide export outer membrane protein
MLRSIRRMLAAGLCVCLLPLPAMADLAPEHVFVPGDEIDVSVLTSRDSMAGYSLKTVLADDGVINLPHVGRVVVVGRTVSQVLPEIDRQYRKLFAYVYVGLQLLKTRSAELTSEPIYVSGQVRAPGIQVPRQFGQAMPLAEVIGRCGGATEMADLEHVTLYRHQGLVEVVNLERALQDGSASRLTVSAGDTVRVPGNWLATLSSVTPVLTTVSAVVGVVMLGVSFLTNMQRPESTTAR